jgi:hypothetical protein
LAGLLAQAFTETLPIDEAKTYSTVVIFSAFVNGQ